MLSNKTLAELERAYTQQKDASEAFRDAVKAQAEKHNLDPRALGRFVRARVNDKLEKLQAEQDTLEQLTLGLGEEQQAA